MLLSLSGARDDRVLQGRPILRSESDIEFLVSELLVKPLFLIRQGLANPLKEIDRQEDKDDHDDDADDGQEVPFV